MKSEPTKASKGSGRLVLTTIDASQSREKGIADFKRFLTRLGVRVIPKDDKSA